MTYIQKILHQNYTPTKALFFNNLAVDPDIKDPLSTN